MTDTFTAPAVKPVIPNFSSGPCAKRPGWTVEALKGTPVGRSHRAKIGKAKLAEAIDLTRKVLRVPADYRIGIVPASDTGAVEMALWSLLGERPVDMLAWESFGSGWVTDVVKQLKLKDARTLKSGYGEIPNLAEVNFDNDVVFTWNGTTSGVRVPNGDWIPADRKGLTICDATSAAIRSNTSVCLKVVEPAIVALPADAQAAFAKTLATLLEKEKAAYDIGAYRDAPPGLRIWCGATVETADVAALTGWLDWAFAKAKAELKA